METALTPEVRDNMIRSIRRLLDQAVLNKQAVFLSASIGVKQVTDPAGNWEPEKVDGSWALTLKARASRHEK